MGPGQRPVVIYTSSSRSLSWILDQIDRTADAGWREGKESEKKRGDKKRNAGNHVNHPTAA